MSTFIQHLQYYFNFEILECLWVVMLKNVENSKDLDDVISSQNTFVNSIIKMSGLDDKIFYSKINQICEEIIEYEKLLSNFSKEIEKYEKTQSKEFLNVLSDVYFKIIIFHKSFKTNTCSFLDVLSTRENLTNLKFRFEFNENYDFVD
ncbi:hypothetical protein A3Q56_07048 [Intoshia linei]|uniref:Gamma tubulin complex component C-terminal domain-containing protein n=1 Tax=Intoshia linei TaxID=1819745 RepID=A0A177ATT9_9BILA|nr:hypothetical protein A3Q56_07048 [Intoshia linei]